ncbi:MAG: LptE family protein [Rhodothermales bacterium]|nr:LptE family protein [Rhodothermales bacterium]MDG2016514.1 LptE family protein [Rhodothermales bacterium]
MRKLVPIVLLLLISGCGYYSFTGATIPEHLGSIAIPLVEDNSISTVSAMDEEMTQLLIDRFVRQTRLSLEPNELAADALLSLIITRYDNVPTSVSGNEQATRNRVSITVSVQYQDQVEDAELLNRTFSAFEEYDPFDPDQEESAAFAALIKIAEDIFTAATSNW